MREIPLCDGAAALVDDEDFDWLNQWKWHLGAGGYASRREWNAVEKRTRGVLMHRLILNAPPPIGYVVDHINRNRLDNRRANLRLSTFQENARNRVPNFSMGTLVGKLCQIQAYGECSECGARGTVDAPSAPTGGRLLAEQGWVAICDPERRDVPLGLLCPECAMSAEALEALARIEARTGKKGAHIIEELLIQADAAAQADDLRQRVAALEQAVAEMRGGGE